MDSILVTGASGFIGSFIVEEALQKGYSTWAAIRKSSSKQYLQDPAIHFIELDYTHPDILQEQLKEHASEHGAFTYIVHSNKLYIDFEDEDSIDLNFIFSFEDGDLVLQGIKESSGIYRFSRVEE